MCVQFSYPGGIVFDFLHALGDAWVILRMHGVRVSWAIHGCRDAAWLFAVKFSTVNTKPPYLQPFSIYPWEGRTKAVQVAHLPCLGPRLLLRHRYGEGVHPSAVGHREYVFESGSFGEMSWECRCLKRRHAIQETQGKENGFATWFHALSFRPWQTHFFCALQQHIRNT